jgi:hypothetical protein
MTEEQTETMPANERLIRTGGVMRCCIRSLSDDTTPTVVGSTHSCIYEKTEDNRNLIVADDGVWEWNR